MDHKNQISLFQVVGTMRKNKQDGETTGEVCRLRCGAQGRPLRGGDS